jgi:hypothetical protein
MAAYPCRAALFLSRWWYPVTIAVAGSLLRDGSRSGMLYSPSERHA